MSEEPSADPWPSELRVQDSGRLLKVTFDDGVVGTVSSERLRDASPSADKKRIPLPGGRTIAIVAVEQVGNYAVRIGFDDGHDTGLYSWDILRELAANQESWWARYLERLGEHGMSRDSDVTKLSALPKKHIPKSS